jgi:hypothetical protein
VLTVLVLPALAVVLSRRQQPESGPADRRSDGTLGAGLPQ